MNEIIGFIIIGLLQGVLEWLPVSSEGNIVLVLTSFFGFGVEDTINTSIFLHLGTGLAALVFFREEAFKILLPKTQYYSDLRLKLFVITILTGVVGFPIFMWLSLSAFYGETILAITGFALIITGLIQRDVLSKKGNRNELTWPLSIVLGSVQGLSIIPGLSRSGITTATMFFNEFTAEEAFRIGFLMSIPASLAATFGMMLVDGFTPNLLSVISASAAAVSGFLSIGVLLKIARLYSFWKICVALGVMTILSWILGLIFSF